MDGTVEVANSEEEDELGLEQTERETADKVVEACTARISENEIIKVSICVVKGAQFIILYLCAVSVSQLRAP